ncbi:DUF4142 domain-containing protein [Flavobacterium sp. GA093]|uniref:DUF4142 domain-containing protein n=1 Tax=Flavobacterium hydrocarbonoxydans TaxID=2683249 RepID=A0A6I4NMA4_9FLAO|nr:DUF4142 domain-containing protein [Flavobacterium hydrocarbonoxydans]MWB95536.1 DUF4142 domain-containing protein [Flavobacterium hydrocarbonoxydans]
MKVRLLSETFFFRILCSVLILASIESCEKNERANNSKNDIFENNATEEKEAYFFITTANVSKNMISKSQIAQQKSSNIRIKELSKKIEHQQNKVFQNITIIASRKLIIITEIYAAGNEDLYELMDTSSESFDKKYLNSMADSLAEEIVLFKEIAKETDEVAILKLTKESLSEQYELLKETEKLRKEIN